MAFRPEQHRSAGVTPRSLRPAHKAWGGGSGIYGHKWRKARSVYLAQHPMCMAPGCDQPANEVDHIKRHKGDLRAFWDSSNWQALCKGCHSEKTMRELNADQQVKR